MNKALTSDFRFLQYIIYSTSSLASVKKGCPSPQTGSGDTQRSYTIRKKSCCDISSLGRTSHSSSRHFLSAIFSVRRQVWHDLLCTCFGRYFMDLKADVPAVSFLPDQDKVQILFDIVQSDVSYLNRGRYNGMGLKSCLYVCLFLSEQISKVIATFGDWLD